MSTLLLNVLLALAWAAATGEVSLRGLAVGFGLGFVILWGTQGVLGSSPYFAKVGQVVRFAFFYLGQLILANLRVAYDIVTPTHYMHPGVVAVPLDARTEAEVSLLANLVTLTPGTLSVDLSPDRRTLYVHAMYMEENDPDAAARAIKQ